MKYTIFVLIFQTASAFCPKSEKMRKVCSHCALHLSKKGSNKKCLQLWELPHCCSANMGDSGLGYQNDGCVEEHNIEKYAEEITKDSKLPPADQKFSVAEIQDIIIKYNTTNVITCDQRPGYIKSELDFIFAISGCFVIIAIILLIFLLIRWKSKNREVLAKSQSIRNQLDEQKCLT